MNELDLKKKEIADVDNLRIERDGILSQMSVKASELSELTTKVDQVRSTKSLIEKQLEEAKKDRDHVLAGIADEAQKHRAEMNERAATVSAGEKKLEQDRMALILRQKSADDRDSVHAERELGIKNRERAILDREKAHEADKAMATSSHADRVGVVEERERAVSAREVATTNREEESAKKEGLLKLQGDDIARDRGSLEAQKAAHGILKAKTEEDASANRSMVSILEKQATDNATMASANEEEKKRLEEVTVTLKNREGSLNVREMEVRLSEKKLAERERAVQLLEQLA